MSRFARTPEQIATIIRNRRLELGLTQSQLAEKIASRQATISRIESGEPATRLQTVLDILTALDLDLEIVAREKRGRYSGPNAHWFG